MLRKILEEKIQEVWIVTLSKEIWVHRNTLNDIAIWKNKKYHRWTLNAVYDFFKLDKTDEFYINNLKKWNLKTPSLIWNLVREKRTQKMMWLDDLSRETKTDKRALARLEAGDSLPTENSWTFRHIFEVLEFTKEEKQVTSEFIKAVKDLEKILKNYEN